MTKPSDPPPVRSLLDQTGAVQVRRQGGVFLYDSQIGHLHFGRGPPPPGAAGSPRGNATNAPPLRHLSRAQTDSHVARAVEISPKGRRETQNRKRIMRTYQIASIARLVGRPFLTVQRNIKRSGFTPAHQLVVVSGSSEIVTPLFAEDQLREVAAIARGETPAAPVLGAEVR
jgi:hypothetical protein